MGAAQMFAGMDTAPLFGTGQYFSEGEFVVKAKSLKVHSGYKGTVFIAEFEVVESNNTADPPGATRSWVVKMGAQNKNAFSDIKSLMFALALDVDPKKVPPPESDPAIHAQATEFVKIACDADYAKSKGADPTQLEGMPVRLSTFGKKTRPSPEKPQGGTFTVHAWAPYIVG